MTVPNEVPLVDYVGNGTTKEFNVPFQYETPSTLLISVNGVAPPTSDYSFNPNTGNFVFYTAPASGAKVRIVRDTPEERDTDYDDNYNTFRPRTLNKDFDRLWRVIQEHLVSININKDGLAQEILDRIQADEDMLDYILNQDNAIKQDYIQRDSAINTASIERDNRIEQESKERDVGLKSYIDNLVALITSDPSFNGITTDFVTEDGETQRQKNDKVKRGIANKYDPLLTYQTGNIVLLDDGTEVISTIANNTNDPNVDMTGWELKNKASAVLDESGNTQQEINNTYLTQEFVTNDGVVVGGVNVKSKTIYSYIAPDVRMSYIAFGGHIGFPNNIGTFAGSGASYSTISGGYDNQIDCIAGTISGGAHHRLYGNLANTTHNTVGGGSYNDVERGEYVTISGGTLNKVKSKRRDGTTDAVPTHSTVGGGRGNIIYGGNSTIAGGLNNSADGDTATVGGGQSNKADGNFSTVAGGGNNEARLGTLGSGQKNTISGGRYNVIDSATNPGGNVIGGGENNNVFGSYNTVSGGFNCDVGVIGTEPSYAAIGGGLDNKILGVNNAATVSGGRENTASANYAGITHGRGNSASAQYSRVGGFEAIARIDGCDTIANGKFSVAGDAQSTVVIGRVITTDATPTQIGSTILLNDNTTHFVTALIVARRSDAQNESAAYKVEFVVDRQTGAATSALVGTPIVTTIAEDDALMNVGISVNAGAGGWHLSATGVAAKTVRWVARNTIVEVSS